MSVACRWAVYERGQIISIAIIKTEGQLNLPDKKEGAGCPAP